MVSVVKRKMADMRIDFCHFVRPILTDATAIAGMGAAVAELSINNWHDPARVVHQLERGGYHCQLGQTVSGDLRITLHKRCCGFGRLKEGAVQ